ncbi:MAG: hypothetical protein HYY08_02195 [Firmicutes bacterium]|nr:hypothetical protein [Bacillota bacterium]
MKKVKLGIAGCGATGVMFGVVLRLLENGVLTAVVDPDREKAERCAGCFGVFGLREAFAYESTPG